MKNIGQNDVVCIESGTTLRSAKEIMAERRIRHLPIVDKNKTIISLISKHDFTNVDRFQDLPVDLFASQPVVYVSEDTPIRNVALKLLENKISCVLLSGQDSKLVGIITTDDLLFHLAELLKDEKEKTSTLRTSDILITAGEFFRRLSDIGI
jgi:acetoin utilization protein AcuB